MEGILNYLQNLKPGGTSNNPKSKFEKNYTEDSELDSPENPEKATNASKIEENNSKPKRPRKALVKQQASEFLDVSAPNDVDKPTTSAEAKENHLPKTKRMQKLNEPETDQIEKMWQDLQIGQSGYLTISELDKVCTHLGMTNLDKDDLKSLFERIDTDHDKRVSLEEFSVGLKEYHKTLGLGSSKESLANYSASGLFTTLDPHKTGICDAEKIVEFWASGGILNGGEVLEYFDLPLNKKINLVSLSTALEKEISIVSLDAVTLAAIITYQKELYYCRSTLAKTEKALVKSEAAASNQRISNIASDAQNLHVNEKSQKEADKIKEYESVIMELSRDKKDLEFRIKELTRIEMENTKLINQIKELKELNMCQTEELDAVAELHHKMETELKIHQDSQKNETSHFTEKNLEKNLFFAQNKIYDLEKEIEVKTEECKELKEQIKQLKTLTDSQMMTIKTFSISNERRKDTNVTDDIKINRTTKESLANGKGIRTVSEEKYTILQNENSSLKNKLISLDTKVEIAVNRERQYQIKLKEKEKELGKVVDMEVQLKELQNEMAKQRRNFEKKLNECSEEILKLEREKEFLGKSLRNLEEEMSESKQAFGDESENMKRKYLTLEKQMKQYSNMNTELENIREENKSKDLMITKLENANDRLSISLKNLSSKLELVARKDLDINQKQLINENIQIQKENVLLEEEISRLIKHRESRDPSQVRNLKREIKNLEMELIQKNYKVEDLEERMKRSHRDSPSTTSDQKKSFKKYDFLQFQYDELNKKYQIQLEQVEKSDALIKDLYDGNAKLLKSLNKMEELKENSDMRIVLLEEKVKTLQNLLSTDQRQ